MARKHAKEQNLDFFHMKSSGRHEKTNEKSKKKEEDSLKQKDIFDFNNEIVIGVNVIPEERKKKPSQKKQKTPIENGVKKKKGKDSTKKNNGDIINLDNEIVIGVDVISDQKKDKPNQKEKVENKHKSMGTAEKKIQRNNSINSRKEEQKRKIRKKIKVFYKTVCVLVLGIGIVVFFMTSPMFNIKEINVKGIERLSKEQVVSLSGIEMEKNMYQISTNQIEEKIKENAYVKDVQVKRRIPDKIEVEIQERHIKYMLPFGTAFVYMDSQGYLLEVSDVKLEKTLILGYSTKEENLIPGNRVCVEDLEKLDTVLKIMESATINGIDSMVTQINISNKNNYVLRLEEKDVTAYLGDASNINDRILVLKQMLITEEGKSGEAFLNDKEKMFFREKTQ